MKILNITAQKPNSTGSGVYLTELVKAYDSCGYEQAVVAGITHDDSVSFPENVKFYPVFYESEAMPFPVCGMSDEMPYHSTVYSNMTDEMVKIFSKSFIETITNAVSQFNPDVIICHHLYLLTSLVRKYFPKNRVIGICHGSDIRQIKKNALEREFIIKEIPQLDKIIVLNDYLKNTIKELFNVDDGKVELAGSGYNDNIFFQVERKSCKQKNILYVGKISEAKGVFSLLRALNYLDNDINELTVTIVGGAPSDDVLNDAKQFASQCKYNVCFTGNVTQYKVAEYMKNSDVFVLPSFYEGSPLVLAEALACGMNVVCNDLPGVKSYYDQYVQNHNITFVKMPRLKNVDEPFESDLSEYEKCLADAISKTLMKTNVIPDLHKITWSFIANRIIA